MKRLRESGEEPLHPARHHRYIIITLVGLVISTFLVVSFTIATNYEQMKEISALKDQISQGSQYEANKDNLDLATEMLRTTRAANISTSRCKPLSEDTLPAANLFTDRHFRLFKVTKSHFENDSGGETGIYKWLSPDSPYGFLNGRMTFDSNNGQLQIPQNGIYYLYATIRFKVNTAKSGYVDDLIVSINVNTTGSCLGKQLFNKGRNTGSNPESHVVIPSSTKGTSHSTHIGGVSRLCKDDFIYLTIKNMPSILEIRNDVFPTNFGAFMIAPDCNNAASSPTQSHMDPPTATSSPATTTTKPSPATTDSKRCSFRTC